MPPTQVWQPTLVARTQPAKLRVTTIRRMLVIPVPPLSAARTSTHQAGRAASTPQLYRLRHWEAFNEFGESPHNTGCIHCKTCYDVATW
jgi:hypothetical protein